MNNYLFANLATGKITGKRGGGVPVFTLGEENPTQIYFFDYPKPIPPYNASIPPLGDAFTYSPTPINKDSSNLTLRIGTGIESAIIQQSSWSNLPNNAVGVFTIENQGFIGFVGISGEISIKPNPADGVFKIRIPYQIRETTFDNGQLRGSPPTRNYFTQWAYIPYYASEAEIAATLLLLYSEIITPKSNLSPIQGIEYNEAFPGQSSFYLDLEKTNKEIEKYNIDNQPTQDAIKVVQSGDFSFFFSISGTTRTSSLTRYSRVQSPTTGVSIIETVTEFQVLLSSQSPEIDTSKLNAPSGKYSNLNFNNPQWESLLGSENEKEIWIDTVLDNRVVAQGKAILRKKLSV
jgi:hypothetical protein